VLNFALVGIKLPIILLVHAYFSAANTVKIGKNTEYCLFSALFHGKKPFDFGKIADLKVTF